MKKLFLAAAVLLTAGATAAAQTTPEPKYENAVQVTGKYENAVQVTGKAEKKITPDEIYVAITVKDGDIKGQNINQIESRLKSELQALGIDVARDLRVSSMANAPKKKNDVDTKRSYELKVGDVWTLNSVFETLGEMGIAEANVTRVSHSRMEEFRREVRIGAMQAARDNAQVLAAAVGQTTGPAVWIYDNGYPYESSPTPVVMRSNKVMTDSVYTGGTAETGLDFQDITLTYSITAKFQLNY